MLRRVLPFATLSAVASVLFGILIHAHRLTLANPGLAAFLAFLVAVAVGVVSKRKLEWFAVAAPILAVALTMRGVFAGPALYANYAVYATLFALFAGGRTAVDHDAKRYRLGDWARGSILIAAVGWVAFLATAPFASP